MLSLSEEYTNFKLQKRKTFFLLVYYTIIIVLDIYSGPLVPMTGFYLIAIALFTFTLGKTSGLFASMIALICREFVVNFVPEKYSSDVLMSIANINYPVVILVCTYLIIKIHTQNKKLLLLASRDSLTGLYVPKEFESFIDREIDNSIRKDKFLSLAFIDLDDFKLINDTYGHAKGDATLKEVSRILVESVRSVDYIARLGGDEFSILFPETTFEEVQLVVKRLQTNLAERLPQVTMSIGVLTIKGSNTITCDNILHEVDMLMYEVKKSTKNNALFKIL